MSYARIVELERAFDAVLPATKLTGPPPPALMERARQWSEAVWQTAVNDGPLDLNAPMRAHGLSVAKQPIFICGAHRSGTTLVRDLLDGHPALAVLPSEGTFFTNFERHIARWGSNARGSFLTEWIRRTANPINQPPYWLLGRSTSADSPSVRFARAAHAWWTALESALGSSTVSWPLPAVTLAFGQTLACGDLPRTVSAWAEKTPTNEQHAARLMREYPQARFIHVVRHPFAVFASRKRAEARASDFRAPRRAMRDLEQSFALAHANTEGPASGRYLVVRYEDIVADVGATMARVADTLGIEQLPVLFTPTVGGQPSISNTSFDSSARPGEVAAATSPDDGLTPEEREMIAAIVGGAAARFGYSMPTPGPWRTRYLKLRLRWNLGIRAVV